MDWEERGLLALNLDYLWRSILFAQDKIFTYNEDTLSKTIRNIEREYSDKFDLMKKELEASQKLNKSIEK